MNKISIVNLLENSQDYTLSMTVGMPLFNMGKISNIAIESLCRQNTEYFWELIICEEQNENENKLGVEGLLAYVDRLEKANCKKIKYIKIDNWQPLGQKWKIIANESSDTVGFMLAAGDDYNHSLRIQKTCEAFLSGYSYYDEQMSFFYSFKFKKTILFDPDHTWNHPCKINMAYKTSILKKLPDNDAKRSVDGFLFKELSKIEELKKYTNKNMYMDSVNFDGYNLISDRDIYYLKEHSNMFKFTDIDVRQHLPIINEY